jgi:hypothetical protein
VGEGVDGLGFDGRPEAHKHGPRHRTKAEDEQLALGSDDGSHNYVLAAKKKKRDNGAREHKYGEWSRFA